MADLLPYFMYIVMSIEAPLAESDRSERKSALYPEFLACLPSPPPRHTHIEPRRCIRVGLGAWTPSASTDQRVHYGGRASPTIRKAVMNRRNDRQSFLGEGSETTLANSRVAIVGLCGGGSQIAQQLAHVGVGDFVLIDPDVVEESNLNRMVGSRPEDAVHKRQKTVVISKMIRAIAPQSRINAIVSPWEQASQFLLDRTVVFGCVDSFRVRGELEAFCRRYLIPFIDIGMDVSSNDSEYCISGQVVVSLPGGPCMRCIGYLTESILAQEAGRYGDAGERPQVIWPNGVLASLAVGQFVQLVTPWHSQPLKPYLQYDGIRQIVMASPICNLGGTPTCPHFRSVEVGDPFIHRSR